MKTKILFFAFILYFIMIYSSFCGIILRYPIGGEVLFQNDTCKIIVDKSEDSCYVDIQLWDNYYCTWDTVDTNVLLVNSFYNWVIPSDIEGNGYRIKIFNRESNFSVFSKGYFTILNYPQNSRLKINDFDIKENDIILYPNPVENILYIKNNYESIKKANIYNNLGIEIQIPLDKSNNINSINCENLSSGVYIIEMITFDNKHIIKTFVKY
jgi:hypothetical protein